MKNKYELLDCIDELSIRIGNAFSWIYLRDDNKNIDPAIVEDLLIELNGKVNKIKELYQNMIKGE